MHRTLTIGRLLLLACVLASCANTPYVVISPAKPKPGETLLITYDHSSPDAVFRGAEPLTAHVLVPFLYYDKAGISKTEQRKEDGTISTARMATLVDTVIALEMLRDNDRSHASVTVPAASIGYAFVKFGALGTYDANRGAAWRVMLHAADDRPMSGAYLFASRHYRGLSDFGIANSVDSMLACYRNEKQLYPGNAYRLSESWPLRWNQDSSEATRADISAELDSLLNLVRTKEYPPSVAIEWLEKLGRHEEAIELRKSMEAKGGTSLQNADMRVQKIWKEEELGKRNNAILAELKSGGLNDADKSNFLSSMIHKYLSEGNIDSALYWYDSSGTNQIYLAKEIASLCLTKPKYYERGISIAKKAIDDTFKKDSRGRLLLKEPWPVVFRYWPEDDQLLAVYAEGLTRAGRNAELLKFCTDAYESLLGASIMLNSYLVKAYYSSKAYADVLRLVPSCIDIDRASDDMFSRYRMAYQRHHGTDAGMEDTLTALRARLRERTRTRIAAQRIDREAKDGLISTLEGRSVRLSELRGKVVVLEFWSSWSGSHVKSFPKLSHACARFRNDPRVEIFAINALEHQPDSVRDRMTRNFQSAMTCVPPFAIDNDFAATYHLNGMPVTMVIGKNGRIQFRERGTQNTMMAEEELAAEIEFLLNSDS